MRALDYSSSSQVKGSAMRKATDMPRPASSLAGVTLWGTPVGAAAAPPQSPRPTSRCNHLQNAETVQTPKSSKPTVAYNHLQNVETSPIAPRPKLTESRINESHLSNNPIADRKRPRCKVTTSRINEGSIVFGASDTPSRPPPPRVEPFQETPRRGHVRQVLPGFTDAHKFGK